MKPQGRRTVKFKGKEDCHCKKNGLRNWWEVIDTPNKKREKEHFRREIQKEIREIKGIING